MNRPAADFLARCFTPGEAIAILARKENPVSTQQRILPFERAIAPRFLGWLEHENRTGANIYVAANPLRPGSRKRTKQSIASVRHLYVDVDTDGDARVAALRASDAVPSPTAILSTSAGKYQVLWRVDGFDFAGQELMLKLLAIAFGGDIACTDCNRVLRIPGFLNRKYEPAHRVTVEYPCDSVWNPGDFRLDLHLVDAIHFSNMIPRRTQSRKQSNSEQDWAWVCEQLAHGKDAAKLTGELATRRQDKSNPLYYARRTVDVASARLWLIAGIRLDDIVTMLESRRRLEIPRALCSVRAWEIAQTAMRMVVPQKYRLNSFQKEKPNAAAVGQPNRSSVQSPGGHDRNAGRRSDRA